jgi:uncharacterized protein YkwD
MLCSRRTAVFCLALVAPALRSQIYAAADSNSGAVQSVPTQVGQLFALGNQARASHGLAALEWDKALAAGAMQHCMWMAQGSQIAHRYRGEPELTERAAQAGAHFSLIEENIAVGPYASGIHQGWMNSPEHRANLLSLGVDRVGIAVIARGARLYAVADYAHAVPVLTQPQVEAGIAGMLRASGLTVQSSASEARAYCASSGRLNGAGAPSFLMRWQSPDVSKLPPELAARVASGAYRQAAVGSCPAQNVDGAFTVYRTAVLLYGADAATLENR